MPGATINQADFDTVVSMLPTAITATVIVSSSSIELEESADQDSELITDTEAETEHEEIEELSLTWNCDTYKKDEAGNWPLIGDYTFQADLPEGYVLAEDMEKPEVIVQLGEAAPYAENNAGSYNVTVTGVESADAWVYDSTKNTLTIQKSGTYTITGDGQQTSEGIIVGENLEVTLTVDNVNCLASYDNSSAMSISASSTVVLILKGKNIFSSKRYHAGVEFANSQENCSLTIQGDGALEAKGGWDGAGIGGGRGSSGSNITISGGTVTATGGMGAAGIGGGGGSSGSNITIRGGTVIATSSYQEDGSGAGIGGGNGGTGSDITISGGTVTATGSQRAAGIGGGGNCAGSNITISGGTVSATGGQYATGIGGGAFASGSNITISGGIVTATGDYYAAGIGGGSSAAGNNIKITGGTIIAAGGQYAAGIGGGNEGSSESIIIEGGTITAVGEAGGYGIGAGNNATSTDIQIKGGSVKANCDSEQVIGATPTNGATQKVYLFKIHGLSDIDSLTVDDKTWTREGNHADNDGGFYLYLTGMDHTIVAGGKTYDAKWNAANSSFTDRNAPTPEISVSNKADTLTVNASNYTSEYGTVKYACIKKDSVLKQSDWKNSTDSSYTFIGVTPETMYTCYVQYTGNETYYVSALTSKIYYTGPDTSVYTINYKNEYVSCLDANIYQINTSSDFTGTDMSWGRSLSDYISDANGTEQKIYVRVREKWGGYHTPASEATEITIPKRPQTPEAQVTATANSVTLTQEDAWEYSTDSWADKSWNSTNEFTGMGQNQTKTCYVRVKATDSSFASAIQTVDATTSAADYTISIPTTVKAGSEVVNIAVNTDKKFDLGNNGHVDVKAVSSASFTGGILTMKYTGNEENIPNITSQMKVKDSLFTDLSKNIASFRTKDDAAVKIEFEKPKPTQGSIIRAGEYSGTVTFTIEYKEGQ